MAYSAECKMGIGRNIINYGGDKIVVVVVEQKQDIKQGVQEPTNVIDDFSNDVDIPEPEDFDDDSIPF